MHGFGSNGESAINRWAKAGVLAMVVVGVGLRLVWPSDMEYKGDEVFTYERTQRAGVDEPWPWIGMSNSADVPHPGMSVWVFLGLAKLFGAGDPVALNIACMIANAAALVGLVVFVAMIVPKSEQEPWWWAVALVAVNPLAVLFHRKIWPPSFMPPVTLLLLAAWWHRDRKPAAFAFGMLAAVAAQIHPGSFFFVTGLACWDLLFDRRRMRWLWATVGGAIGSLTAIPWLYHLLFVAERSAAAKSKWWRPFELKFWNYWFTEPFGFNLNYSLGADFADFLRWPIVGGQPTYAVGVIHALLATILLMIVGRWGLRWNRDRELRNNATMTGHLIGAVGIGYGVLLTATALPVYRHYMIITFPLMFVWKARMALRGFSPVNSRRMLAASCGLQCLLTVAFLAYVHAQDRTIQGDYGMPYAAQMRLKQMAADHRQ